MDSIRELADLNTVAIVSWQIWLQFSKKTLPHCDIQLFQMFRIALQERHMFLCMSFASDHCSQTDCYLFAAILHAKLPIKLWYLLE